MVVIRAIELKSLDKFITGAMLVPEESHEIHIHADTSFVVVVVVLKFCFVLNPNHTSSTKNTMASTSIRISQSSFGYGAEKCL